MNANRLFIGVGNPLRRDDGAGPAVIQRLLAHRLPAGTRAMAHHGEGLSLLDAWQDYASVTIVDATRSGRDPGTLCRFAVSDRDRETVIPRNVFSASSHVFGVAEAIALARSLGRLPPTLVVYGIEGAAFGYGEGLSPPVQAATAALAQCLAETVIGCAPRRE